MSPLVWIGFGITAFGFLSGAYSAARSRNEQAMTGGFVGAYLGFMFGFPLLAIGLANQ